MSSILAGINFCHPKSGSKTSRCLSFTPTLFTPTGIASTFTYFNVLHILRTAVQMDLKFWLVIDINHHKLISRVTPRTKIICRKIRKVWEVEVKNGRRKKSRSKGGARTSTLVDIYYGKTRDETLKICLNISRKKHRQFPTNRGLSQFHSVIFVANKWVFKNSVTYTVIIAFFGILMFVDCSMNNHR